MKITIIAVALLLSACGQKGALYLPETLSPDNPSTTVENQAHE